jgi:hypothetical protein
MKIKRDCVLSYLREKQERVGGYTGTDLVELAEVFWFKVKNIKIPPQYSVEEARDSLSSIFTFSGLKTYGGADLPAIYERLVKAKEWFSAYGVDPISYYPHILARRKQLRSLLTSIPPSQQEEIQKRLIFEIQDAFIVECTDILTLSNSSVRMTES